MTIKRCDDCIFWLRCNPTEVFGECRIKAPVIVPKAAGTMGVWPLTLHDSGCGQHQPRPPVVVVNLRRVPEAR